MISTTDDKKRMMNKKKKRHGNNDHKSWKHTYRKGRGGGGDIGGCVFQL